jgi:hypothetical protein
MIAEHGQQHHQVPGIEIQGDQHPPVPVQQHQGDPHEGDADTAPLQWTQTLCQEQPAE